MTRVILNGRFLCQPNTGVQRYARETLLALDALLKQVPMLHGLEFVLCVPRGAQPIRLECIHVKVLPQLRGHLWEQLTLAWYARGDLLVGFSYSGPLIKRHQIITVHDATVDAVPACFSTKYRLVHNVLIAALVNRVRSVMTVSRFSADEIRTRYGIRNRIVVGREGWSHCIAQGDDDAVLQRWGLTSGRYLLLVGSIKPNKNLDVVGRALAMNPLLPWTVAVVGARDSRIFKSSADAPGNIQYLGFVPDEDLGLLYKHAAWFLFPSRYEGFGLPAIEAMANGCPVVAANAASLPEVCSDAALYFDPDDHEALAQLLASLNSRSEDRKRLLQNARARLQHYTWTANAQIVLDEIVTCLGVGESNARNVSVSPT
jgi:glycosyltransferase involved in cell wall biosynthesis